MPGEITQKLGFDAAQAIDELRKLQSQLNQFKQGLQSTSGALRKFPSRAAPAIAAMRELANAATQAGAAMGQVAHAGAVPTKVASSAATASSALAKLSAQIQGAGQRVQTGIVQPFNRAVQSTESLSKATKQAANATKQAATTTGAAARKAGDALEKAGKKGQKAANLITLSWKTVIRVVQAQVIVRGLSRIVSMFGEAHDAALKLSIAVAEVSTISGGALGPLDNISASVLELSRSLGLAADEIAEGLYQTLSNQVVEAGDALRFEATAAKLSIATHAQLKESVNALSSVMNSYGLDVSEVGRVSDVLFKTIELGRLRMGEFGDVLGRVTPLTAALGIEYEEMAGALAALTQKGIPAHTAITQLTQVSQKLLRPTEKLQELYKEWGVDTGPEAIRRFGGLAGVLLKMKDATAGNDAEFADLLGRVRAMVAGLNLTSEEGTALTKVLDDMANSAGITEEALAKMEESAGRKAVKAWNELNVSIIELGNSLLSISAPIAKALDALVSNLTAIAVGASAAGAAALVAKVGFDAAWISMAGFSLASGALLASLTALLPVLAVVAIAVGAYLGTKAIIASLDTHTAYTETRKKQMEELTKAHEENTQTRIQATRKQFKEMNKVTGEGFSAQSKAYRKTIDVFEASSESIKRILISTQSEIFAQRKKGIEDLKKATLGIDDAIKDSLEEVVKAQEAIAESAFKNELKHMNARQQLFAEIERTQQQAAKARAAYAQAGANEEAARDAREISHVAEKKAQDAVAHAEEIGNLSDVKRAEGELEKIRADRIRGEITFQLKRKKLQDTAHKDRLAQLDQQGIRAEELAKKLQKLLDPEIGDGGIKSIEQRKIDAERFTELLVEFKKVAADAFDLSLFESVGGTEEIEKLKAGLEDAFSTAQFDWANLKISLQKAIEDKVYTVGVKIKIENEHILDKLQERFGEADLLADPGKFDDRLAQTVQATIKSYEDLQDTIITRQTEAVEGFQTALDHLNAENFNNWMDSALNKLKGSTTEVELLRGRMELLSQQAHNLAKAGEPWTEEMRETYIEIAKIFNKMGETGELAANTQAGFSAAFKAIAEGYDDIEASAKAENEQLKIKAGTFEESLKFIDASILKNKEALEAQKELTEESVDTKQQLEDAKQATEDLPGAAQASTEALAAETDQARQLKTELQGALEAQKELATTAATKILEAQADPQAAQEPQVLPAQAEPISVSAEPELSKQAGAAKRITNEFVAINNELGVATESMGGMSIILIDASNSATILNDTMSQAATSTSELESGLEAVKQSSAEGAGQMESLNNAVQNSKDHIGTAAEATIGWTTQLGNCAAAANSTALAMQAAAKAAIAASKACASASGACSGGGVAAAYYGGYSTRYRQEGGPASRGQDRIPIMAAPGEFIVSARNARRFASELQAMNSGVTPNFRDRGGSITNVGDINVTVPGAETTQQTAREIASALRRELRRGTSRLN